VTPLADGNRIASYYDALVDRYGHDPRACDASGVDSLQRRYRVLGDVLDLTGKRLLEIGCGFGDLGASLRDRYETVSYRGVDLSPRMVEAGRAAHGLDLRVANLLDLDPAEERYDVVLAQGIFYLLDGDAEAKMRELVRAMTALADEAVAFTAVSSWTPSPEPDEYYVDPVSLLGFCRTLTPFVAIRHDYHPGDVAAYLYLKGAHR
jgi:SAM-dependent methyltransferase